jgi:hypothetical protein
MDRSYQIAEALRGEELVSDEELRHVLLPAIPSGKLQVRRYANLDELIADEGRYDAWITFQFEKYCYLHRLFLVPSREAATSQELGKGVTKEIFRRLIPVIRKYGLDSIRLEAAAIGRYAWARYGFNIIKEEWPVFQALRRNLGKLLFDQKKSVYSYHHLAEIAVTSVENAESYRQAVEKRMWWLMYHKKLPDPFNWVFSAVTGTRYVTNNKFLIGKWFLLEGAQRFVAGANNLLEEVLDFNDIISMSICKSYIHLFESTDDDDFERAVASVNADAVKPTVIDPEKVKEEEE